MACPRCPLERIVSRHTWGCLGPAYARPRTLFYRYLNAKAAASTSLEQAEMILATSMVTDTAIRPFMECLQSGAVTAALPDRVISLAVLWRVLFRRVLFRSRKRSSRGSIDLLTARVPARRRGILSGSGYSRSGLSVFRASRLQLYVQEAQIHKDGESRGRVTPQG